MTRFKRLILSAAISAVALAAPLAGHAEEAPAATKETRQFPAIIVTKVEDRNLTDRLIATGTVKAVEEVYIQPQVDGLAIQSLGADIGDRIEKGAVMAVLSTDALLLQKSQLEANKAKAEASLAQLQAQLIEAKANADEAVNQRERARKLKTSGTVSTSQVDQLTASAAGANARVTAAEQAIVVAKADMKVVDAQIADIDLKLARTDVKAPVSGVVSAKNAKVGAIASAAGQPLFTVIRDGAVELVADVAEGDVLRLKPGLKARITLAGGSDVLDGSIRLIDPTIDPTTRLASVHIAIDDPAKARAGMYGSAEIIIKEVNGMALPLTAVNSGETGSTARKVKDDRIELVKIDTGVQDGDYIQVLSGLTTGDTVVAKAGAYVRNGDRITPVEDMPTASN
ncbi:efflux RND transporter periplasmic adaptor subunit [Rhizobium sp. PAMB 3182]